MPIRKKWSPFNKDTISRLPNDLAVYEIADCNGKIQYIGEGQLRNRLNSHFLRGSDPIPRGCKIRFEKTGSKRSAEQRERALLGSFAKKNKGKLPPQNKRKG